LTDSFVLSDFDNKTTLTVTPSPERRSRPAAAGSELDRDGRGGGSESSEGYNGSTPDVQPGNPVIAQGGPRAMQWAVKVLF
jgi:hypothetical protein